MHETIFHRIPRSSLLGPSAAPEDLFEVLTALALALVAVYLAFSNSAATKMACLHLAPPAPASIVITARTEYAAGTKRSWIR
ncbi:hypothetical protein FRC12_002684 [Ceratobasidium sp. 428]|nr:hypothetical protein FRC12_002684 [Ceratobasidium sp. 428]